MTTTTTTTTTTSSATASAAQALFTSLSTGSGVDTASLVTSLVQAQFAAKTDALTKKSDAITAQISGASTLMSNVSQFAAALKSLATGGTLQTQPVSSNAAVVTATALPGAKLSTLSSSISVAQLASGQVARTTTPVATRTTALGTGQLTLTLGTATYDSGDGAMTGFTAGAGTPVTIDIVAGSENLDGIAAAINAAGAGVTASVVTDADGTAYLSMKGASGAAQAFTLTATDDPSGNLSQLNVGVGATGTALTSGAQNARLTVDGVTVERASNTIDDLVTGVKLQLTGTSASPVSLTATTPTDALKNAVGDFVDTYNEMLKTLTAQLDPQTGPLRGDAAAQTLLRSLRALTTTPILTGFATGTPTTLGEVGVKTNRDGTLSVDTNALTHALSTAPDAVEAMFSFSSNSTDGLTAALNSISLNTSSTLFGLGASTARYNALAASVAKDQDTLSTQSDAMTTRLTQQFASMNAKVAAYKSTQAFLQNQIAAWNKNG
ncbi:MAG: flagellar filament capping protein FliD [Sphingomonas sp.]|uniref:flagellar filament capping protein FliD n=1 Tax=Sphingomonas sp. TaxID=28214 RepID=UPI001AC0E87A|nr:flagellar filament capping protein FliD [Sphingomonas sp.]MBN8816426.1 flagellar filament capping protein FliD [Sphingomonas sp.]